MENTGQVLFDGEKNPKWYVAIGERYVGPFTAQDVYERIVRGEVSWAHYVWTEGQVDWKRICDVAPFQAAVPGKPREKVNLAKPEPEVKKALSGRAARPPGGADSANPPPVGDLSEDRSWFLYYNDSQFGPFSFEEISRFLRIGKIHGRVYAWRDGMSTWEKLEKLVVFDDAVLESKRVRAERSTRTDIPVSVTRTPPGAPDGSTDLPAGVERRREQRLAPRRPLLARMLITNEMDTTIGVAVCRDISIGGMQVLTDKVPGVVGTRIRLNVSPAGPAQGVRPFVAQGIIVRILEDGRGFSFRFEKLRGDARRAIEEYVGQPA